MITAKIERFTPSMAKAILDSSNEGNRRLRMWWAIALAAAIKRGEWITTHQGIAFTQSGRLIDGQHRLMAIVLAGMDVEMFVFKGISDDAFKVIDCGVKRRTEDVTGLSKKTAEAARFISSLTYGGTCSAQVILDVAHSGVEELHERLMSHCCKTKAVYSAAPVRAAAIALVMDGYPEIEVFDTYANLINQKFDALPPVAHGFIRQVNDKKVTASNPLDLLARAIKTLNPDNKQITKVQISDADGAAASQYVRQVTSRASLNSNLHLIKAAA